MPRFGERYGREPWNVPVPLRESSFVPLDRRDATFNVEVDLGAIGAFADPAAHPVDLETLLWSDLQMHATTNLRGRLGSGRSGFYRGRYLKGMGRTPLAATWTNPRDGYHNSGHLLPSAAIREWVVSRWLERQGGGAIINACDGLLLRPLPREMRRFSEGFLAKRPGAKLPRADRALQAISLKRDGFCRFTNFVWMLNNTGPGNTEPALSLGAFFVRLDEALPPAPALGTRAGSPEGLVDRLGLVIERGVACFLRAAALGVCWHSTHNNFLFDGRFVDLEIPSLTPPGALVLLAPPELRSLQLGRGVAVPHLEAFDFLREARDFVQFVLHRLALYRGDHAPRRSVDRDFVDAFTAALRQRLGRDHLLGSARLAQGAVVGAMLRHAEDGAAARRAVRAIVRAGYDGIVRQRRTELPLDARPLAIELAAIEPANLRAAFLPSYARPPTRAALEAAREVNALVRDLEDQRTVDGLLTALESARGRLRRPRDTTSPA